MSVAAETERLRLRTWREADKDALELYCNTEAVMRLLGGVQPREKIDAAYNRITRCQAENGFCFWVVERIEDGAFLGFCGLKRANGCAPHIADEVEIGWRLREDVWGQGYAKEAAGAALGLAFARFDAPRVVALTVIENSPSWGLMERLGMSRRPDWDYDDPDYPPELNPTIVYAIEAGQWTA